MCEFAYSYGHSVLITFKLYMKASPISSIWAVVYESSTKRERRSS